MKEQVGASSVCTELAFQGMFMVSALRGFYFFKSCSLL